MGKMPFDYSKLYINSRCHVRVRTARGRPTSTLSKGNFNLKKIHEIFF